MNIAATGRRALAAVRRYWQAARQLATDKRIPAWVRILLAIGCVQVPFLPFDEIALATALIIIAVRYRAPLADAVKTARKGN